MQKIKRFFAFIKEFLDLLSYPIVVVKHPIWAYRFHVLIHDFIYALMIYLLLLSPIFGVGIVSVSISLFFVFFYSRSWMVRNKTSVKVDGRVLYIFDDAFLEYKYLKAYELAGKGVTYEHKDGKVVKIQFDDKKSGTSAKKKQLLLLEKERALLDNRKHLLSKSPDAPEEFKGDEEAIDAIYSLEPEESYPVVFSLLYGAWLCLALFVIFFSLFSISKSFAGLLVLLMFLGPHVKREYIFADKRFAKKVKISYLAIRLIVWSLCVIALLSIVLLSRFFSFREIICLAFVLVPYLFLASDKPKQRKEGKLTRKRDTVDHRPPPGLGGTMELTDQEIQDLVETEGGPVLTSEHHIGNEADDLLDENDYKTEHGAPAVSATDASTTQEIPKFTPKPEPGPPSRSIIVDEAFDKEVDEHARTAARTPAVSEEPTDPNLLPFEEEDDDEDLTDPRNRAPGHITGPGGSFQTVEVQAPNGSGVHDRRTVEVSAPPRQIVVEGPGHMPTGTGVTNDMAEEILEMFPNEDLKPQPPKVVRGGIPTDMDDERGKATILKPSPGRRPKGAPMPKTPHPKAEVLGTPPPVERVSEDTAERGVTKTPVTGSMKNNSRAPAQSTTTIGGDDLERIQAEALHEKQLASRSAGFDESFAPGTEVNLDATKARPSTAVEGALDSLFEEPIVQAPANNDDVVLRMQEDMEELKRQLKAKNRMFMLVVLIGVLSFALYQFWYVPRYSKAKVVKKVIERTSAPVDSGPPITISPVPDTPPASPPVKVEPPVKRVEPRVRPRPRPRPRSRDIDL